MGKQNSDTSHVVLCTDGCANWGLGSLSETGSSDDPAWGTQEEVTKFYSNIIYDAKNEGVTIHINSFEECNIGMGTQLGDVPVQTGGLIRRSNINNPDLKALMTECATCTVVASRVDMTF